jgi:hypothetical protein
VLDLETFYGYDSLTVYTEHHAAVALRDIAKRLSGWSTHAGQGAKVFVVDEEKLQARRNGERERRAAASTRTVPAVPQMRKPPQIERTHDDGTDEETPAPCKR